MLVVGRPERQRERKARQRERVGEPDHPRMVAGIGSALTRPRVSRWIPRMVSGIGSALTRPARQPVDQYRDGGGGTGAAPYVDPP